MTKIEQLRQLQQLKAPTAPFIGITYGQFLQGNWKIASLNFPLAVRSTFTTEDGGESSMAGQFLTELNVEETGLQSAIQAVFDSYPDATNTEVIVQEMVQPDFSGVLFAFRNGIWKAEWVEGLGENLVSGKKNPKTALLPRFQSVDVGRFHYWWGVGEKELDQAFVQLSKWTGRLLSHLDAPHGLDIEFAIRGKQLYLLQARPITTPLEAEEVLTSANHKEILPPKPSRLMSSIIADSGEALFGYYRDLDATLPQRSFIMEANGMPWINLSALLDLMVHWGLPTSLVARSVGATDVYQVGIRPLRILQRFPVFFYMAWRQTISVLSAKRWVREEYARESHYSNDHADAAEEEPAAFFKAWKGRFQQHYIGLVSQMQSLTGAMSGPVSLLDKLGVLAKIPVKSKSTNYAEAFLDLAQGQLQWHEFVEEFGHRGFYESDLGQKRFREYTKEEWQRLIQDQPVIKRTNTKKGSTFLKYLFSPIIHVIHTREWLRHETMKFFETYRMELMGFFRDKYGEDFNCWDYPAEDLMELLEGEISMEELKAKVYPEQSGWNPNTFVANRLGRSLPISMFSKNEQGEGLSTGISIYPGTVRGQVWRVQSADLEEVIPPKFESIILVADALDPGWVPYFAQVNGVVAYVGGLLSHASIILRESSIPSITQLPASIELKTGDWIEMDGKKGSVVLVNEERVGE